MLTRKRTAVAIALGVALAFGAAHAELVLDQPAAKADAKAPVPAPTGAAAAPTAAPTITQTTIPAENTKMVSAPITAPVMPAVVAPAADPAPTADSRASTLGEDSPRDPSKGELKRRIRMREELKNEDLLQERLETLRLRDEAKRTSQILKEEEQPTPAAVASPLPVQTQAISAPVTDHPGVASKTDQISIQQSSAAPAISGASAKEETKPMSPFSMGLGLDFGTSSMKNVSGYEINARYSAGLNLNVGVSDNVTIDMGYHYNEYGLKFAPGNGFVEAVNSNPTYYLSSLNTDTHTFKQNVFELGVRLYVLNRDYVVRPYLGGGAGYSKGYVNYEQQYINLAHQLGLNNLASDYEVSQYLGYLTAGVDIQVAKHVSLGIGGKYYNVLTATENQPINNGALAYPAYNQTYFNYYNDPAKQYLSGSIAHSSFYSILANVTFDF